MASWHRFFLDFARFLGASWEAKWSQDRFKKALNNDAKNNRNQIAKKVARRIPTDSRHPGSWSDFFAILVPFFFPSFFRCIFGSILAPFCLPTWLPKSTKIQEKMMPRCLPMLNCFFDRFLIDFCFQLGPSEPNLELAR